MKKNTLLAATMACLLTIGQSNATAQTNTDLPSTSRTIYNFEGFNDFKLLQFFYELDQKGRKYPTVEEMKEKGIYEELEFVRSHVRKRNIMSREDRLVKDTYENRNLFMNIPAGAGKTLGGYPSRDYAHDNYSMWNYTNLFGAWNHGLFQAPGSWVDAAHKNGTDMLSGVKFFEVWSGNAHNVWKQLITSRSPQGEYLYARPMINLLMFLGMDGINYNWEAPGYDEADVIGFHKSLYKIAAKENFHNFHVVLYTHYVNTLTTTNSNALFGNSEGRTADVMLNYVGDDFTYGMGSSVKAAKQAMNTTDGLYAGVWIVTMNRGWSRLNASEDAKQCGICLWGEHGDSRFWSFNAGGNGVERMANYQKLLERGFSGGNRSPINRPGVKNTGFHWEKTSDLDKDPLYNFPGLATWIPERSAIQGKLPFYTGFNLGNGERYNYKGKKTAGSWYNMSNQDVVPTYRWLVYDAGTTNVSSSIQPEFTIEDAYTGGTSLRLNGTATSAGTDIILYKTKLTPNHGKIYANIALKDGAEGNVDSKLSLILKVENSSEWKVYPLGEIEGKNWVEKKVELNNIAPNDVIERIGFRVGSTDASYRLYVGKLEINDDVTVVPGELNELSVEVKEETKTSLSVKAMWDLVMKKDNGGLVYNDEANIDHFQVLYKNGENGRVSEIGRTSQWATFIGDIRFEGADDQPYLGVRSVGTDLKTYSSIKWVQIPRAEQDRLPEPDATEAYGKVELDMGAAGAEIAQKVRFMTDFQTEGALENITYQNNTPVGGSNYVNASNLVMKVQQGQTVTLKFKGYMADDRRDGNHDDLRYCMGRGWIDLNDDKQFHPDDISSNQYDGESLFFLGRARAASIEQVSGLVSQTFTVPNDAAPGKTIMRIVFSDAWFPGTLLPTGKFQKGFAIDFGVEIVGNNPARQKPVDPRDQGTADEPEKLNSETTDISASTVAKASDVRLEGNTFHFESVENAWIFTVDGKLVKSLNNPKAVTVSELTAGVYLVKMKSGSVIRTKKLTVK